MRMRCLKCGADMFTDIDNDHPAKTEIFWCLYCGLSGTAEEIPIKAAAIYKRMHAKSNRTRQKIVVNSLNN